MRIETIHPGELGAAEAALWREHQRADPALSSPYLSPVWAQLVGAARADARVCVINSGQGFLGVQRRSRFAAMGLGAPIADYQGLVGATGLEIDAAFLCKALNVGRIDLAGVPAGQALLGGRAGGTDGSLIAEISTGADAYRAQLKKQRSKIVRQTDNRMRKLGDAHGELVFAAKATERADFATLLGWKLAQLRAAGQPAIWAASWVRQVVEATYASNDPSLNGALFTLRAGEKLVAASYALCNERVAHVWMIGHDQAFDVYSPGVMLARWLIEWAADEGFAEVDFGGGDYQFKRHLCTTQRPLEWGAAARPSWSGAVRQAQIGLRTRIETLPQKSLAALPGKAMRRLDLMRALAA